MSDALVIYGATGYTGRAITRTAVARGLNVTVAGRDANKLRHLAAEFGVAWQALNLQDTEGLIQLFSGACAVLNVAGPFAETAVPVAQACLTAGVHYLDVSGELPSYRALGELNDQAVARNLLMLPGAAFVVAPSDCLALYLKDKVPNAKRLFLGMSAVDSFSRGTLQAMVRMIARTVVVRRNHRLTGVHVGRLERLFDFGNGARKCAAVSWADVFSAYHSTGIPNIEAYVEADALRAMIYQVHAELAPILRTQPVQSIVAAVTRLWPQTPGNRHEVTRVITATVEDPSRQSHTASLALPDGYVITPPIAVELAARVLDGDWAPGLRTPAQLYGVELLDSFDQIVLHDGVVPPVGQTVSSTQTNRAWPV